MRISDWSSDVCSSDLQPHRLGVIAELRPAYRLPQLVHRPDTAGDGEEAVGEVGEHALSLVHPRDDMELGDAAVRDLCADERVGDHPDHLAARLERRIGDRAHQPEPPAAIDDADAAARQRTADVARGFDIDGIGGGRGPAIDGEALHSMTHYLERHSREGGHPSPAFARSDENPAEHQSHMASSYDA